MKVCTVTQCQRPTRSRGYCSMHYQRVQKHGHPGSAGPLDRSGDLNANWRGGIAAGPNRRYRRAYAPDHPYAVGQYVLEHRLVMERHLGRLLRPDEVIHHINGDTRDNRVENLEVMQQSAHAALHFRSEVAHGHP